MSIIFQILLILILQVNVAPCNRVYNKTGNQCVWASLETIGRHFHIKSLCNLTQERKNAAYPTEVIEVLSSKGVDYYWQPRGKGDLKNLKNAILWHWPTAVEISWEDTLNSHVLLIVDVKKDYIKVIDNSNKKLIEEKWNIDWFLDHWTGFMVTIPDKKVE